jgi:uncharacterized protein YbjQ (UPF0145 family)
MRPERLKILVLAASVLVISSAVGYAVNQVFERQVQGQASVFQGGGGQGSSLGQSIQDLTRGIIAGTNEQVQNTLQNAGQQALPQLQANASKYECIVVIMHFGKASGAMTCSGNEQFSSSVTTNSANAPGISAQSSSSAQGTGNVQSSIQRQGGSTLMQNQLQGSGSSANVIPGDVP